MNIHSLIEKIDSKALINIVEPSVYSLVKLLNQNNSNQDGQHTYKNFLNSIALEDWITQKKLRDFLIEAERFAEEEVANLWSLTLKKEKELEKKVKQGINKLRKQKNNN